MRRKRHDIPAFALITLALIGSLTFAVTICGAPEKTESELMSTVLTLEYPIPETVPVIIINSETDPITTEAAVTTTSQITPAATTTVEAPKTTAVETDPEIDANDFYWMAHLVTGEVQDESWECQVAAASVILNRVHHKNYPNTIPGVIKDRKNGIQYACYWDGNFQRKPTDKNRKAAKYVLENGSQIPSKVIYQGQHIIGHLWKKIGSEYFCYD